MVGLRFEELPVALRAAPVALLLIALLDMPCGYYSFLRINIFLAACMFMLLEIIRSGRVSDWSVLFALAAILMNPIVRIRLDRETWEVANLLLAALFSAHFLVRRSITRRS